MHYFLDLAKAFDSVSHDILLSKLEKYGIRGNVLDLFKSYLSQRYQFVELEGKKSPLALIEYGVPQGSILGPLLFLIYINDLPQVTNFFIKLYAEDTFLCSQHKDIKTVEAEVNSELEKVYDRLASNKLTPLFSYAIYMGSAWVKSKKSDFEFYFQNQLHGIERLYSLLR